MDDSRNNVDDASGSKRKISGSFRTIDTYFMKKPKHEINQHPNLLSTTSNTDDNTPAIVASTSSATLDLHEEKRYTHATDAVQCKILYTSTSNSDEINSSVSRTKFSLDMGLYVGKNIEDSQKAMLLKNRWMPAPDNPFLVSFVTRKGNKINKCVKAPLDKFPWLVFSKKDQGFYCRYCVLFAPEDDIEYKKYLRILVNKPLKGFENLLSEKGVLQTHQRRPYHELTVKAATNFLLRFQKPENKIINQISNQTVSALPKANEKREYLRLFVETIIFCGHQNISLHDHGDDGKLLDEGNLRALLKFRKQSCNTTMHNLETSNSNRLYISKTERNQLIDVCEEIIQENIFQNVKEAKYFSILFNETTDITSHITQLYLSFRYLQNGIVREDFVTFCDTLTSDQMANNTDDTERRFSGVALAKIVENICLKFDIDLKLCIGIGTNTCAALASEIKVAIQELSKKAVHAKSCPFSNHVLNSLLATSCELISCRNALGTMRKVIAFINSSAQTQKFFEKELGVIMRGICETRWVERYDGHQLFKGNNLVKICSALEKISAWQNNKISNDAYCLLQTLCSPDFIMTSICLRDVLDTTVSLSKLLQMDSIDLKKVTNAMEDALNALRRKKADADHTFFRQLFEEAKEIVEQLGVEIKCPIKVSRETQRAYPQPAQSAEAYFRKVVYVPLLDSVINELQDRLSPEEINFLKLDVFVPKLNYSYTYMDIENVKQIANHYKLLIDNTAVSGIISEYQLWMAKWERNKNIPQSISNLIENCDAVYTNVRRFLCILATLPVSVGTAERPVSKLKRLETWLSVSKAEDRLTGLALLYVHKNIPIQVDEVITRFERRK